MPRTLEDIRREKTEVLKRQKRIVDRAIAAKRNLNAEENKEFAALEADYADLEDEARYLEKNPKVNAWLNTSTSKPNKPMPPNQRKLSPTDEAAFRAAFQRGDRNMDQFEKSAELREGYEKAGRALLGEERSLQKDLDSAGGFVVQDVFLSNTILHAMDNLVFIRKLATIFTVDTADRLGIPVMDTDMSDLSWTGEVTPAALDTAMNFERRQMMPKRLAKAIKVSNELKAISASDFAKFIIGRGTYKAAAVEENAFLNGSGVSQPLGLFVRNANGCGASCDVTTGNTSSDIKADNLIEVYHSLKSQYLQSTALRWIFSRETLKKVRKMKDGEGNYLWAQGFGANPATVLGVPYVISEFAPSAADYVSGARVACLADLSFYGIAQRQADISVKVLDQLYALENCTAYLFQTWVDGMPLVEEAFAFCTLS